MDIFETLKLHGQEHLADMEGLSAEERAEYLRRLSEIDWETVELWKNPEDLSGKGRIEPIEGLRLPQIEERRAEFERVGVGAVRDGKVAAVLLAGGQGTRLGSNAPKGTYDIGITHPVYIFERLFRNLLETTDRCGAYVPLYIMTSERNDAETQAFLRAHAFFGYPEEYVAFFRQEMAPSVDFDGKILLEGKGKLALSPNGNGGWYSSLVKSGLDRDMKRRGVEWINVFAVDNVLQRIADPAFIGATILSGKPSGAKVVCKAEPGEKVGVLCLEDGRPAVIEYYEMSAEMANLRDGRGDLVYLYGVILNYLFNASRLEEIARERIPVHVVKKKIPCLGADGTLFKPETENGYKFETLILDMVKLMGACLPYEVVREREFAPIKNKTGVDSVESARELLAKNGVAL